eukprot:1554450-Prymnesium_polylepis.1
MAARDLCRQRYLYYRGDDNYGLGNVLFDVGSAAAVALVLNRTLVYAADQADRKFGSLLLWPNVPTMRDVDDVHRRARCGVGVPSLQRRAVLAPDRCTFQKSWRKERRGDGKCFRRLLGADWLAERAAVVELSKSHAFTGVQTLLKSAHRPLRLRVAALAGGCVHPGARPNTFGHLLAALMRPSAAILHAVRWVLAGGEGGSPPGRARRRPQLALHVRAM